MAKFIEDRSSLKKKKKKENAQKAAPSSANKKQVSNIANQVVNRTANAAKKTTNTVGNSAQRQNTVRRNVQSAVSQNAPHRYNNRPSGAAQPSTDRTVQDRLAASRQRREQAEADIKRRRQESEARSKRISQSRNARMQDTARGTKLQTEEERRQRQDRLRAQQEQKMGNNSMASKEVQKAANRAVKNTPTVVKESAKQVGIGHGKTLADITEANKSAAIGSKIDIKSKEFQEDIEKRRKESTRVAKSSFKTLSDMQEKSEQKLQDKTKDAKGLEKAYYGALESGVGMATDRLAGPAWAVSMLSRTYGNTRGQAQKEGATEDEDRAYSLLQAAKEVATEYMLQGVGLAKGLSGRHSLSLGEMAANAITKNMRGPLANATHAGIRFLGGVGEENAEEAIGWGLDPFIKEFTYGRNVRTRQAQQMMREQSDALRSNITNMDDARAIAAYLGSDDFLDSQIRTYMDSGIGKEEARDLAENMRDYLDASLSGDTEKMADIEESLSKKLSGRGVKDILKQDLSLSELKDTIASTTLLTATTGLPGTVTTTARGAAIKEQLGTDGIRALAKTAEDFEDGEMQLKAKAMSDRLDAGKDITNTQAYDLAVGVTEQYNKDADRQQTAYQTAQKTIKSEKLVTPYRVSRDGDIQMDEVTDKTYKSTAKSAKSAIETFVENSDGKESLTDTEIDRGSRAIAGFKTGVFTVDDANELNFRNTAVRSAFEKETGIDLNEYVVKGKDGQIDIPATNTATKNALFAKAADNLVATAQAETANWVDNTKGEVVTQISRRMGASGTAALQTALDDVDERDRSSYMMTANASDVLYQSARNMGTEWENAKDYAKRMFPNVAEDKLKAMYEAGLADRDMATDEARGQQIKIGEKVELKKQSDVPTGQVIIETSAPVKGSVIRTFTELARNLGVDIHLVDHFTDKDGKVLKNVNGEYIDGNIFINVNSDFEKNMGFIFMHEVTHHLKLYAPEQYKALENLVREKWFKYDSAQMQSEIAKKIETYAKHGQTLTEEQALEEIIADAAHEFLTDRNFAREIANEDASLAQAVLTSIRNALRMLRRIMSADNLDETHMNTLFSQLDILDEAERLWLDAYKQAVRNNAAVAVDRLQNQIYEDGKQSATDSKASYSLSNMPSIDDLDMTNSTVEDENGDMVAEFHDNGSVRFSISSFDKQGRKIYTDYLDKQVKNGNLSRKEADDMMHELETVYGIAKEFADKTDENGDPIYAPFSAWSYADVVTDEKGKPVFSAIKKNSEYKMNIDFSTICKKRRTLDAVFREMINRGMFEKLDLNKDESAAMVVNINNLIRQHKFEAACALCFVEARRYRQQQTATTFRDMWNNIVESMYTGNNKAEYFNFGEDSTVEAVPNAIHTLDDSQLDLTYVKKLANEKDDKGKLKQTAEAKAARLMLKDPSQRKLMRVGDMMASTGFENMQIKNPELMKVYNSKKGTGGAKSSFGDVQYLNEILKPRSFSRKSAYAVSGVRIQSFSDYVPRMVFDYVQVIADLAAKHLPAHGYTKEPLFVKQFGLTGAKINMSLVPDVVPDGVAPGLDKDGNYIWNEEGTFPYDEAMAIQEAEGYKENCGTIAVGISDEHIMKMLADPTIQMVIPYHKSSLNPIVAAMTNVDRFENYEKVQTTKDENGNTVSKDFDWDNKLFRLSHDSKGKMLPKEEWGNVQDLVKEYADWCKAKSYTPKFPQFLYLEDGSINPGYYKLLEDFALLDNDGNFKPQGDVQMRFPTEDSAFGSMKDLIAQGLSEDTELEAKRSSEISGIVDEIEGMFDQGTLTEQSATSEKLAARMSISEDLDEPYMQAVNSGNMKEAQRLVDEAAKSAEYDISVFHGTTGIFDVFDRDRAGGSNGMSRLGFWFTETQEGAQAWAENSWWGDNNKPHTIGAYIKLKNPKIYETTKADETTDKRLVDLRERRRTLEAENQKLLDKYGRFGTVFDYTMKIQFNNAILRRSNGVVDRDRFDSEEGYQAVSKDIKAFRDTRDRIDAIQEEILKIEHADAYEQLKIDYYHAAGMKTEDALVGGLGMAIPNEREAVEKFREQLKAEGYDGIIIRNTRFDSSIFGGINTQYVVFEPEQVKSADPVTYAEDGSVIPLSQRFDPTNNDIRYSMSTEDADGNVLTTNQMEYFKNSQARDENGRLVPVYHSTYNGGFTIFEPSYSDDDRSLFFTNYRTMSESYISEAETGDINPYEEHLKYRTVIDVNELPDGYDPNNIFGIEVRGKTDIYEGDDYLEAAKALARYAEADGWDLSDFLINVDEIYNDGPKAATEAWNLFAASWEFDVEYQMSFSEEIAEDDEFAGTYTCYLNLENPLIVDAKGKRWNQIPYDSSTYSTRQIAELAEAEGYDGVIVKNVVDYGHSGYVNAPADVYIAFRSNQVKDIRNENPTENPDVRFSITEDEGKSKKDYDHATDMSYEELLMYEDMISNASESYDIESAFGKAFDGEKVSNFYSALTEEVGMVFDDEILEEGRMRMAKSKADFWSNLNTKWQERWETKGEVLDTKSVKTNVRNLIRGVMNNSDTDRQYKTDLLNKTLMDMRVAYQLMKQDRTDIASALLYHSALRMITDVDFIQDDTEYQEYKGIRDYLRGEPITVSDDYWQGKAFQQFRKEHYGTLKLRKGETNVDKVYMQLEELYPHIFNETEREKHGFGDSEEDLLQYIGFVTEQNMQPFMEAYSSEECAEWAFEIADDLYEIMENGEGVTSLADRYKEKYDAKAKVMKTRHAEAILRVRKQKQAAIDALKEQYNERLDKQKEHYNEKLDQQKEQYSERLDRQKELAKDAIRRERERFRQQKQDEKERTKERRLHSKYFDSIVKSHKKLSDRLLTNTKDKHIPEQYKKDLAELLAAFDLQTVASKKLEIRNGLYYRQNYQSKKTIRMKALQETLLNIQADSQLFYVNDSITEIIDRLLGKNAEGKTDPLKSVEGRTIDELTSSELKDIDKLLKALIHEFNNYESVRVGAKRQQAADIGTAQIDSCLDHAGKFGEGLDYQNFLGALDNILNLDEVTPAYMFRQIDPQSNGIGMMFKELRRSFGKYVRNQNQLNEWMEEIIGEYHNKGKLWNKYGSALEEWRISTRAKEFQLTNGNVKLTPAQMMSIYCLSHRQQAYDHMTGAGIVVQPVSFQARMASDLRKRANYALPVILTDSDIKLITSKLTPDQIKVADKLQKLMATKMAEWGNEASMSVMGIRLFEDPDYFPIKSDKAALEKDFSAEQFMDCIRNFGFTKAVQPGARNAIAIGDIFDVVAEHCNNMNLYNAYSEAMNDFMKVYNFHAMREDGSDYSVEQAIAHAYSKKATTFISTFMKDLNGNVSRERTTGIEQMLNDSLGKAKKASVFANGRVALQQPTALMRAFAVISPKYLKGVKAGKATMQEMFEHSPIALWKSWGYYDINMGKSIEDLMMNNGSWAEDKMSDLYGELDNRTWAVIWTMCKNEIEDKHKDVEKGSDEYWELVSERFDEVVDLTQVVDSPFHRSHAMRSKNTFTKMATAFMAEPTLTYNMVRDGFRRAKEELRLGNKKAAGKIVGRTVAVFALSAWATAAAAAIWDAVRGKAPGGDDDDEQGFFDMWFDNMIENLKDNLNLLNNIYYVKDVVSMFQGWDNRNLGLQGWKHFADAYGQLTGRKVSSKLSWYENVLAGVGYLTGKPYKTMLNDGKAIFKMFGLSAPGFITDQLDKLDSIGSSTKDMNRGASSSTGISDPKTSSKSTAVNLWTYDNAPFRIEDGSAADNFLNHFGINLTSAEIAAAEEKKIKAEREKKVEDIKAKTAGMSGVEKDRKVWSYISSQIKKEHGDMPVSSIVEAGDYNSIYEYREMYVAAGGNTDYFDERIFDASKKAMKKSIVYNPTDAQIEAQDNIRNYLTDHGMSESELSEIAYKSYTAKELKVAFRLNDEDAIVEELTPLVRAGLSLEDFHRIYDNRNRIDLKKYKESGGKYAEKLKSMGDYNWPCNGTITSTFGHRSSPGGIGSTNHQGIDIGASMGAPVTAADGGVVVRSGWYGGYGKTVQIQHDDGTITQYSHLSWWEPKVGDVVAQGQEIGKVGSTGNSTGPHLHFGVMKNGEYVDPMDYLNKKS